MRISLNESGASRLKVFLFFVALFLVIHVGIKVIPMYMDYSRMEDEMTMKASLAQVLQDRDIVTDLVNKAKDLDLPLTADSFNIERDDDNRRMKISTQWDVHQVFLWGAYERTFHFAPSVDEGYMEVKY